MRITFSLRILALSLLGATLLSQNASADDLIDCKSCVAAKQLRKQSITTAKIATGAVSKDKLGSDVKAVGLEGVVVISAGDFNPDGANINCRRNDDDYSWRLGSDMGNCCLIAAVRLPNNVQIKSFEVTAKYTTMSPVDVDLRSKDVQDDELSVDVAEIFFSDSDSAQTLTTTNIASGAVDTTTHAFFASLCLFSATDEFHGARVLYE